MPDTPTFRQLGRFIRIWLFVTIPMEFPLLQDLVDGKDVPAIRVAMLGALVAGAEAAWRHVFPVVADDRVR